MSVKKGRLCVNPASGAQPPAQWLEAHSEPLLCEMLISLGQDAYQYGSYTTGRYGPHKAAGVTLQFTSLLLGMPAYVVFNADLNRVRGERKGSPLPKGQFRVGKRSLFYKFWAGTPLKVPSRLSSFHDYMGNLKGLIFTGDTNDGRFNASSITPLCITHEQIKRIVLPDSCQTTPGQLPDNIQTRMPNNDIPQPQVDTGIQPISTTGATNYGNTVIRECVTRDSLYSSSSPIPPQDQTVEQWLADYGNDSKEKQL